MNDILLTENDDLRIENGDFVIGYADNQHQKHILIATKGEYKEFPELGVGISKMLSDDDFTNMLIEAKKNLQYDGMDIENISFNEKGKLIIEGRY